MQADNFCNGPLELSVRRIFGSSCSLTSGTWEVITGKRFSWICCCGEALQKNLSAGLGQQDVCLYANDLLHFTFANFLGSAEIEAKLRNLIVELLSEDDLDQRKALQNEIVASVQVDKNLSEHV